MVVCPLRSGFVLMELQILSNGDITNPRFKLNVSNEIDREFILVTMDILWRSIEISKGLSIKHTRHPMLMNELNPLHDLRDFISEKNVSNMRLSVA